MVVLEIPEHLISLVAVRTQPNTVSLHGGMDAQSQVIQVQFAFFFISFSSLFITDYTLLHRSLHPSIIVHPVDSRQQALNTRFGKKNVSRLSLSEKKI